MEELDPTSLKEKLTFKEHYYKIQHALKNIPGKSCSSTSVNRNSGKSQRLPSIY